MCIILYTYKYKYIVFLQHKTIYEVQKVCELTPKYSAGFSSAASEDEKMGKVGFRQIWFAFIRVDPVMNVTLTTQTTVYVEYEECTCILHLFMQGLRSRRIWAFIIKFIETVRNYLFLKQIS